MSSDVVEKEQAYLRAMAWSLDRDLDAYAPELVVNPLARRAVEAAHALDLAGESVDGGRVWHAMGATDREKMALAQMGFHGPTSSVREAFLDLIEASDAAAGWAPFDPIDSAPRAVPFPIDALPQWVGAMVASVAAATGFAADMAAGFALAALSAAIGGRLRVEPWPGWREAANLFLAVVNLPSEGKSVVFRQLMAPIFDFDRGLVLEHAARVAGELQLREVAEARLRAAKEAAAKASDASERLGHEETVRELAAELERPPPVVPRLVAGDVTPEVCAVLLSQHDERLALLSPEDSLFGHLGGRHMSSSKATPAIEVFLSSYSCEPVRVDRLSRGPICLNAPTLTIGVAMQPSVLEGHGSKLANERGLLARFLYVTPPRVVGYRDLSVELAPVPHHVRQAYESKLSELVREGFLIKSTDPVVLELTNDARVAFKAWRASFEPRRSDAGDLAAVAAWAGKCDGHVLRIAGLLAAAEGAHAVSADAIRRALRILEALVTHAKTAIGLSQLDDGQRVAVRLLAWIRRRAEAGGLLGCQPGLLGCQGFIFSERDAVKDNRSWLTRENVASATRILKERGYIRSVPHVGKGRPAVRWEAHTGRLLGAFGVMTERTIPDPSLPLSFPPPSSLPNTPETPKSRFGWSA